MNKKLLLIITGLFCFLSTYSQCAYTGSPLTAINATPYTFCIDNGNIITTPRVNAGQFALVNVVQGFRYRFSVGNVFNGPENITILNALDNSSLGAGSFASGGNTATIADWTSTISGQIKVLLSRNCENNNAEGGPLTLELLGGNNTFDSQTNFGTNQWVGHVYNHVGNPPPGGENSPTAPATTTPFTAANYVGYYNIATETINETFGGNTACFPVLSNGAVRTNIYTELFSVRYRMRSTRPAGCYILNVNGDDGVRVYVDGALVFSRWRQQGNTSYCNNLINLSGNSEIILDYYEHQGGNVVGFSLAPFDGSGNAITSPSQVSVCSNTAVNIVATDFGSCTGGANGGTTAMYQWQSSPDGTNFTNISGATARNYTAPGFSVVAGNPNNVRYFRRVFRPSTLVTGCEFFSNVVTVTTSGSAPSAPVAVTGSQNQCRTSVGIFSVTPVDRAVSYNWSTTAPGWTIASTGNGSSVSVSFNATATSGDLMVSATNGCGTSTNFAYPIQVADVPTSATISGTTTVCMGAAAPSITITNPQNYAVNVTYNVNGTNSTSVLVGANSNVSFSAPTNAPGNFVYNLVSVSNATFAGCSSALAGNATITVSNVTGDQVSFGNDSWIGYVYTSADPANSNFSSNFVGSVNQPETFDLNLGGGALTAPSLCGSYNDNFAIRFKMTKNFPEGCYTFTVGGDDGYRLSINGAPFVIDNWNVRPYISTNYTVYLNGSTDLVLEYFELAGQSRVSFSYTFQALNIPTIVSTVQPNCTLGTGSVTLSGLPSGSWDLTQSGFAGATISGSGSVTTINGLAPGTYYYTVTSGGCTSNLSEAVVINPVQTTTFNGAVWSSEPTLDKLGIITAPTASPINIDENIELCSCEVSSGTNVVVDEGFVLKLQDRLVVSPTGSLTFNNNSSLVQINDGANNSGSINYLRQTTVVRKAVDYTYWSSPVEGQNLLAVSPNTNQGRFWSFTPGGTWFVETPSTKIMDIGKGYIIRAPDFFPGMNPPSSVFEATFTGQPNNGNLSVGVAGTFNLIGNPYPSAIDAIEFLEANQSVLNGTIYFWTHNTAIRDAQGAANEGTGDLVYIQDDYASFNRTGGVATAPATTDPDLASGNPRIPTGKIAAGQSFFASRLAGSSGTTVLFNNSMRLGVGNSSLDNSQFFRTTGTSKKENESTRNRIWLNVTNKQKAFKQILVGYLNGATNDFDPAFDGATYNANTIINFYSMLGTRRLSIQGRALPFDTADVVPLGYNAFIDGEFSISIDNVDGLFSSQAVYLEDKQSNTVHNLKTGPYTFQTVKGAFNDRFVLRYTDRTLSVDDLELKDAQVVLSVKNKQLKVTSTVETIKDVYIYDLLGKLIFVKKNIGTAEFLVSNLASSEQVLIVKTVLQNEAVSNLKTIYR